MDEFDYVVAFARDRQQHMDTQKLSDPDPWMLATYAFDLQRKQNYLYMANRMRGNDIPDHWPQTPRELLNVILNHNRFVADAARRARPYSSEDWEARARMLELIIRHQAQEIYDDTHDVLTRVFGVTTDPGEPLSGSRLDPLPDLETYVLPKSEEST